MINQPADLIANRRQSQKTQLAWQAVWKYSEQCGSRMHGRQPQEPGMWALLCARAQWFDADS
jgi:hypothetical protein